MAIIWGVAGVLRALHRLHAASEVGRKMRSPGHDPAGVISRHPANGMWRLRPDRLFEIEETMSAAIRFISDLKEDSVSQMAEGAASLSPVSGVDHSNIRIVVPTFSFGDEPSYLFVAETLFDFVALLDEKRPETLAQR
jgi:hypothetical protein